MAKVKELSLSEICDKICELEAYEQFLDNRIRSKNYLTLKSDYKNLALTRTKLDKYRNMIA